jgi:hypothetical protein
MSARFIFTASVPPCHLDIAPGYRLSIHAWQRMCARGLSPSAIRAALEYGRVVHLREAEYYLLGRAQVAAAARVGIDLHAHEGVQVVVAEDGTIKTAYRNHDFSSVLSERGNKPRRRPSSQRRAA